MNYTEISNTAPVLTPEQKDKLYAELAVKEKADHQRYRDSLWQRLCPPLYDQPLNYARIEPKNHAKVRAIVEWKNRPKSFFICGPTGRAKTRACWQSIKPLWYGGTTVVCASGLKLSQDAVKVFTDHENGHRIVLRYATAGILFLDDLGKRSTPSTWTFLFEVVERRTSNNLPIFVTSNETLVTLAERIDDPTTSDPLIRRLEEFCDMVMLP